MRTGFFCVLLFFSLHASAQQMLHSDEWCAIGRKSAMPPGAVDGRSDSIDIRHTRIELNVASSPQISGVALLDLKVLASSVASIRLDLEGLHKMVFELGLCTGEELVTRLVECLDRECDPTRKDDVAVLAVSFSAVAGTVGGKSVDRQRHITTGIR